MYKVTVTVDAGVLDLVRKAAKAAPRAMQVFVEKTIAGDLRQDLAVLEIAPPPPSFPYGAFPWKSARQRRAYFATNGFGGGIPYRRKHPGIEANWKVVVKVDIRGGTVEAGNDAKAARYVYGDDQQPFHAGRWPDANDTLLRALNRAEKNLVLGAQSILDPFGKGAKFA